MSEYKLPMLLSEVAHGTIWEASGPDPSQADAELMPLGTSKRLAELEQERDWQYDQNVEQIARIAELEAFIETIDHQYEAMQQIKCWCEAYPVAIFPEPDWVEAREKLGSSLLSRVSASNMRHVVEGIKRIIPDDV